MKFDVPEVREFLMKNGEVYTVRSFESRDRFTVVPVNNLPDCLKEKICKIKSYKDLTRYTHLSGFKSPMEWWRKIEEMKATEGWLYHVSVLEEEEFISPSEPKPTYKRYNEPLFLLTTNNGSVEHTKIAYAFDYGKHELFFTRALEDDQKTFSKLWNVTTKSGHVVGGLPQKTRDDAYAILTQQVSIKDLDKVVS